MIYDDWFEDIKQKVIPVTETYKIDKFLTTPVECAKWASESLPQDELSIQNGILTTHATRWPLCIDP